MNSRVTVVGAGVIGLTCAVTLAEAGYQVDVLARELPLETTSAVAGGLWLPFLAEPVESVNRWARMTLTSLTELAGVSELAGLTELAGLSELGDHPDPRTGVALRNGYLLGVGPDRPSWARGLSSLQMAPVVSPTSSHRDGWRLRVPIVDMTVYLPYLVARLQAAGGTLTRLPLTALPTRGLVVNCTGLASRALAADPSLHPIRGQVVWTTNPGITEWWSDEGDPSLLTYVLPQTRHVVVGGIAADGDWSTTPDDATGAEILARATALVPALRSATVLSQRVGLRPARPAVRLETVPGPEGTTVHCYGHGGSGVTLSWGCASDVLDEVNALVNVPG
jgi:D-amino-acid oxidase